MSPFIILIAQTIASFWISKGLEKIFTDKTQLEDQLTKVIHETIEEYESKYPVNDFDGKYGFYKSKIIVTELLKYRLFKKNGQKFNPEILTQELNNDPRLFEPKNDDINNFLEIFSSKIESDEKFKNLELEKYFREEIFIISQKMDQIISQQKELTSDQERKLQDEYKRQLEKCFKSIRSFNPKTALQELEDIEREFEKNKKYIKKELTSELFYLKGIALENTEQNELAWKSFVKAYKYNPLRQNYIERASISYSYLLDENWLTLSNILLEKDEYNNYAWALKSINNEIDIIEYIKENVPKTVLKDQKFRRIVFNYFLKNQLDIPKLIKTLGIELNFNELPTEINFDNFYQWIFISNLNSFTFFGSTPLSIHNKIEKSEQSLYMYRLTELIYCSFKGSESEEFYERVIFFYYWFQFELEENENSLKLLATTYKSLTKKDSFLTFLYSNSLQKSGDKNGALAIIDDFKSELDEALLTIKVFCLLHNEDIDRYLPEINKYIDEIQIIDEIHTLNICNFIVKLAYSKALNNETFQNLGNKDFSNHIYYKLIILLIDSFLNKDLNKDLLSECIEGIKNDTQLHFFIALTFFNYKDYKATADYIRPHISETVENREIGILIQALDNLKTSNQLELLRLLKIWREKFSFNDYFLRIEIDIRQHISDWNEVGTIAQYGLSKLPNDEGFLVPYVISLGVVSNKDEIKKYLKTLTSLDYRTTSNALAVAKILINNSFVKEGFEIAYKRASNKNDKDARLSYFQLNLHVPDLFKEYDTVKIGRYVKFQIENTERIEYVDQISIDSKIFIKESIGKKVSEVYSTTHSLSKKIQKIKIVRIMNKYLALLDEIFTSFNDPLNEYPIQVIKFEGDGIEAIEKALLKEIGPVEVERTKHREQKFSEYYNYEISFSELVFANFNNNPFNAYDAITSIFGEGFLSIPSKFLAKDIVLEEKSIIADIPSCVALFELGKQNGFVLPLKLTLPTSILHLILQLIAEENAQPEERGYLNFKNNRVVPYFVPQNYKENRISYLNEIKEWIQSQTIVDLSKERLDFNRVLHKDSRFNAYFDIIIDLVLLSQRKDSILISDDTAFFKFFKKNIGVVIGIEYYTQRIFPKETTLLVNNFLKKKYIGLEVNCDLIKESYANCIKDELRHIKNIGYRNIALKHGFTENNINVVISFLRDMALNPVITEEKFKIESVSYLFYLISSITIPGAIYKVGEEIDKQFRLIHKYHTIINQSLLSALTMLNMKLEK